MFCEQQQPNPSASLKPQASPCPAQPPSHRSPCRPHHISVVLPRPHGLHNTAQHSAARRTNSVVSHVRQRSSIPAPQHPATATLPCFCYGARIMFQRCETAPLCYSTRLTITILSLLYSRRSTAVFHAEGNCPGTCQVANTLCIHNTPHSQVTPNPQNAHLLRAPCHGHHVCRSIAACLAARCPVLLCQQPQGVLPGVGL
jgi:hypothetical protein